VNHVNSLSSFRRRLLVALLCVTQLAVAADLHPWIVDGWNKYRQLTEKRIAAELSDPKRFWPLIF